MYFNAEALSLGWLVVTGWILLGVFILRALLARPWQTHLDTPLISVLPAAVVCLLALWVLKAGLHAGYEIHLLGITALTLMFGVPLAILGVVALYVLLAVFGFIDWRVLGLNALLVGVLPIYFSAMFYRLVYRNLPHNYFIFVFLSSFLNGAITLAITMVAIAIFLAFGAGESWLQIKSQFLMLVPLLVFPEAFINGSMMAIMVIYRPEWVLGFNDREYLKG